MSRRAGMGSEPGRLCWQVGARQLWPASSTSGSGGTWGSPSPSPDVQAREWGLITESGAARGFWADKELVTGSLSPRPACLGQELLPACRSTDNAPVGEGWPCARPPTPIPATQEDSVSWSEPAARRCDFGCQIPRDAVSIRLKLIPFRFKMMRGPRTLSGR